jgi:hypothetical protein
MYLILEVKGKGKTHDAVDYVAVTLGELFAGREFMYHLHSYSCIILCKFKVQSLP